MHVFSGFGTILYTGALMGKKLGSVSITVVIGALINIGLNLLLIPSYGVWGATIATMVGYGVPQVVLYQWLQRRYPIPYPMGHFMAALGVQFALQVISLLVPALVFPLRIAIKLAIFAILPFSFIVLGMITKFELIQAYLFTRNQLRLGWARLHS
jgi:peptidoglycan biosynthesis protein MviN/MurJ (putative lipid II flippase)